MPQTDWGAYNITQGNSAFFTAEFFDASGNTTTPIGAILTVAYTDINNLPRTDTITMNPNNAFFIATWSSASATFGLANWAVTATGNSSASQVGLIRVIYP